jgi:flagellar motor switch protein FliM
MILLVFDMKIGGTSGMLHLCIPTSMIEASGATFSHDWYRTRREPTEAERISLIDNLARVPLPLTALLRTSLTGRELLELREGDVISLGLSVHRPLTVRIGQIDQFEGMPVRTGNHAGVELTSTAEADHAGDGR